MWELAVPHLPSRIIDFEGLARDWFYASTCSFFQGYLYFQLFMNARKVWR
jgi:antirestriction protein